MSDDNGLPSTAGHVGQAAGGITGVFAGAAIGATAGPIGVLLGGIAGAIGGWWSGRALVEATRDINEADDAYYREHFARERRGNANYEHARGAYYLGQVAASNPEYTDRTFADVEQELFRGWRRAAATHGEWEAVRGFVSAGFDRGNERRRTPRR